MSNDNELEKLARRFGEFERAVFEYKSLSPGFSEWIAKAMRRRGEILLVIPRGNGRVLLHTKPHYPDGVYRLPTGGIHRGEEVVDAAKREAYEEIGFKLKSKELKLLGLLENVFWVRETRLVYASFVFETREFLDTPAPTDPDEAISGFCDVDEMELRATGYHLASLPMHWREWGKFRAAAHLWLADRMRA